MFNDGIYKIYNENNERLVLGVLTISDGGRSASAALAAGQTWPVTVPASGALVFEEVSQTPGGEFPVQGTSTSSWEGWSGGAAPEETSEGGEEIKKRENGAWSLYGYGFVTGTDQQSRHYGFVNEGFPLPGGTYSISKDSEITSLGALENRLNSAWETWHGYAIEENYE